MQMRRQKKGETTAKAVVRLVRYTCEPSISHQSPDFNSEAPSANATPLQAFRLGLEAVGIEPNEGTCIRRAPPPGSAPNRREYHADHHTRQASLTKNPRSRARDNITLPALKSAGLHQTA